MTTKYLLAIALIFLAIFAIVVIIYPLVRYKKHNIILALPLMIIIICAYWYFGSWSKYSAYNLQILRQQQALFMLKSVGGVNELIIKLKLRLEHEPYSGQGWYLLGRIYASQNLWRAACKAYARAYKLQNLDEATALNYANCLWHVNDNKFDTKIRKILLNVLSRDKDQADALAMLASDCFTERNYTRAIFYWRRLLKITPPNSKAAHDVFDAIAKAQQQI